METHAMGAEDSSLCAELYRFLRLLVHNLLYAAKVYPEQYFTQQIAFNLTTRVATVDCLERYITEHIALLHRGQRPIGTVHEMIVSIQELPEQQDMNPTVESVAKQTSQNGAEAQLASNTDPCHSMLELVRLRVLLPDLEALEALEATPDKWKLLEAYRSRFRLVLCRVLTYPWPPLAAPVSLETWRRTFRLYFRLSTPEKQDDTGLILETLREPIISERESAPSTSEKEPANDARALLYASQRFGFPRGVSVPLCDDAITTLDGASSFPPKLSLFVFIEEPPLVPI